MPPARLSCSELPLRSCTHARAGLRLTCSLEGRAPCCTKFSSAFGLRGICTSAGAACLRPSSPVGSSFLRCAAAHAFRARVHGHITPSASRPVRRIGIGGALPTYPRHEHPRHAPSLLLASLHDVQLPHIRMGLRARTLRDECSGHGTAWRVSVARSFGMAAHGPAHQHDADSDRRREDAAARVQTVPPAPADVPGVPRRMGSVSFSGRSAAHRTPSSHRCRTPSVPLRLPRCVCVGGRAGGRRGGVSHDRRECGGGGRVTAPRRSSHRESRRAWHGGNRR